MDDYQVRMKRIFRRLKIASLIIMGIISLVFLFFGFFLIIYQYDFNTMVAGVFFLIFGFAFGIGEVLVWRKWKVNKEYNPLKYRGIKEKISNPYSIDQNEIDKAIKKIEDDIENIKKQNNINN